MKTIRLCLVLVLCVFAQTAFSADPPKTGEKRDTLLYVRTVPDGAKVLLNGKELGTTNDMFYVEPGVGKIIIELKGYQKTEKQMTIQADEITRLSLVLKQQTTPVTAPTGGNAQQLMEEGWQLWKQEKMDEAIEKFEQAVKLDPKLQAAWNGLGWANFNSGHVPEGKRAFERLIKLNPRHAAALNGLGQIYLFQRKYDKAESYLLKAAPQASAAWWGLAKLYLLQGKFDKAEKFAQRIVASGETEELAKEMLKAAKEKTLSDDLRRKIEPPDTAAFASSDEEPKQETPADEPESGQTAGTASVKSSTDDKDNILKNPGAESGDATPDAWEQSDDIPGVTYHWDKSVAHQGKASLSIKKTANRYFPIAEWSQTVERTGNSTQLDVSAYVKAKKMSKAILDVLFLDKDDQWILHKWVSYIGSKGKADPPANHDWKKYSGRVDIPENCAKIVVGLQVYGPGTVWFDDVRAAYVSKDQGAAKADAANPTIVSTDPAMAADDVDPATKELRVTFSEPMQSSYSWTGGGPYLPKSTSAPPRWTDDHKTCILPVKLDAGHFYRIGINSQSFQNFRSAGGQPVLPSVLCFATKGATDEVKARLQKPKVVSIEPANAAGDVDPATKTLRATFDMPMGPDYSWCGSGPNFPQSSKPSWSADGKTCTLPVELKPNWQYELWINSASFNNFQSASGVPLDPVEYKFKTGPGSGETKKTESSAMPSIAAAATFAVEGEATVPEVVSMNPPNGAKDVDPKKTELRVTFNLPMSGGFSWTGGGPEFPKTTGKPRWSKDHKTCILPVKLKPGASYRLGLNSPSFKNFRSAAGLPLEPVEYSFTTRGG